VGRGEVGIDLVEHPQVGRPGFGRDGGGSLEVDHRFLGLRPEGDALVVGRQESRGPIDRSAGRQSARVGQHHERRQILVLRTQSIAQPGSHAGESVERESAVHLEGRRSVVVALGEHRVDEAQIVDAPGQVRQQIAHPGAAPTPLAERVDALHEFSGLTEKPQVFAPSLELGAMQALEFRFVVEGVQMTDASAAEDLHDPLGPGAMVHCRSYGSRDRRGAQGPIPGQQPRQRDMAQASDRAGEEVATVER
jgi:hypothetical protein